MPTNPSFFRRYATAIWLTYWVCLTGLLHWPKLPRLPIQISKRGLVAHFTTFAILAGLCVFARIASGGLTRKFVLQWTVIFLLFGALSETLQPLSNRHRDLADFIANASGILAMMGYAYAKYARSPVIVRPNSN
ncbi:MAG: hypothetical protein DHS20C16_09530 [Phycisphaerae bacterium]|nr:MAG: hypothetical protein DHS20C16_09530 [Phycisphaerae bacterium]